MPLTRYEIRNEYSLANPDLYRAAAKDDPEGLLEGVAMAGLVGIVRQLGDLAEFAAEVFHDLHEEVLAMASRGHELLIRVQQLEAELPFVEKLMLAESNYANFSYNPGLEWHANIHNDQNHFTQGDLPRFIRNAYEDCRGPPRLFLLDKFDVAGAGACLKRYTDPSFFRMEWASSELMKAEKEQQDKKARRIKKKGRRQRNGEMREAFLAAHMQPRSRPAPVEVINTESTSIDSHMAKSWHGSEQEGLLSGWQGTEQKLESSRLLIPEEAGPNLKANVGVHPPDLEKGNSLALSPPEETKLDKALIRPINAKPVPSELSLEEAEVAHFNDVKLQYKVLPMDIKMPEDSIDFASETDNYVDALTTIDSEVETDSEVKTVQTAEDLACTPKIEEDTVHVKEVISGQLEDSSKIELVAEDGNVANNIPPSEIREPAHFGSPDQNLAKVREPIFNDGKEISESDVVTPLSGSMPSTMALEEHAVQSGEPLELESVQGIPVTPEMPEANKYHDGVQLDALSSAFHHLPEPAVPRTYGPESVFSEHFGSLSPHLGKEAVLLNRDFSAEHVEKDSFGDSESEASEGLKESSPHTSENSSIHPIKWATSRHTNITLDSDDELDGMQVSSSSSSLSSSSALSSPRPSMLATTFFDNKPLSSLHPIISFPESPSVVSPESAQGVTIPDSPASLMEAGATAPVMSPGLVRKASHLNSSSQQYAQDLLHEVKPNFSIFPIGDKVAPTIQDQSLSAEEEEHSPPPPPLPPLEWRMTRRFGGGSLSSSNKASEPFPKPPIPQKPLGRRNESSQDGNLPPLIQRIDKPSSSTWHGGSENLFILTNGLDRFQTKEVSFPQVERMTLEKSSEECVSCSGEVSVRSKELVQPNRRDTFDFYESPLNAFEAFTSGNPDFESVPPPQMDESPHSFRSSSTVDDKEEECMVSTAQEEDQAQHSSASQVQESSSPSSGPPGNSADDHVKSTSKDKSIHPPWTLDRLSKDLHPPLPPSGPESERITRALSTPKVERKDSLIAAIAAHDKSTLRKVPEWSQSSRTPQADGREVLLQQIRTGSFSLRRTKLEKQEAPRPFTNINVAAILEKANAIRQAFAGSDDEDEDDDWSDD